MELLRPYWARQRHSFLQQLTGHKCHAISSQRPDIMLSKSTLTGHFIRYHASPMMGPLLPSEVIKSSCHRFTKVLETVLRDFRPHWHDRITDAVYLLPANPWWHSLVPPHPKVALLDCDHKKSATSSNYGWEHHRLQEGKSQDFSASRWTTDGTTYESAGHQWLTCDLVAVSDLLTRIVMKRTPGRFPHSKVLLPRQHVFTNRSCVNQWYPALSLVVVSIDHLEGEKSPAQV